MMVVKGLTCGARQLSGYARWSLMRQVRNRSHSSRWRLWHLISKFGVFDLILARYESR